ncbi:DUF4114 domain-containing protein [Marivirga sp.]|uniref:DUF4114 domain-containing protein n=1 Tax=Marivirga sp. TaxID=2018662 RepID=UPI0025F7F33B|nr:DUF4114 domain-containing protein [Marivirga sp.]
MKVLNKLFLLVILTVLTFACKRSEVAPDIPETPDDIITTELEPDILEELDSIFPPSKDFIEKHPYLFEESNNLNIVLTEESEVFITFVLEGATLKNSLGYYIYNPSTKTVEVGELDLNILFPHISDEILNQGDMLQLGDETFPAGTTVGFFLILDGWRTGQINYGNETFYTDIYLNSEEVQQHVLFKFENFNAVVLAFEDQFVNGERSDKDYNDVVFTVSDNQNNQAITRFNLNGIPTLIKP